MSKKGISNIILISLCVVFFVILSACLKQTSSDQKTKYSAEWESLYEHNEAPEWFRDAKFGIYFHWGVYSVPAFGGEWYPRNMHRKDSKANKHHLETYGDPAEFGYHDFLLKRYKNTICR